MDWFFDGIGTLFVGLLIGGAGGSAIGYRVAVRKVEQRQRSGNHSNQIQGGRDVSGI